MSLLDVDVSHLARYETSNLVENGTELREDYFVILKVLFSDIHLSTKCLTVVELTHMIIEYITCDY